MRTNLLGSRSDPAFWTDSSVCSGYAKIGAGWRIAGWIVPVSLMLVQTAFGMAPSGKFLSTVLGCSLAKAAWLLGLKESWRAPS